ncbi:MAG: hypothetical protein ABI639_04255 [Thermoanaerobaculia bacterium]
MTRKNRMENAQDPIEREPKSADAGQSGDTEGLSTATEETEESLEDLVESGQDFEAELVDGMEDAANHPEEPVRTHEDRRHLKNP